VPLATGWRGAGAVSLIEIKSLARERMFL
jgi:hypothetical protein